MTRIKALRDSPMPTWTVWTQISNWPKLSLILCFTLWKTLLFTITLASPGPGYDSSTTLLKPSPTHEIKDPTKIWSLLSNFVRWDAIYFVQIAHRGIVFEQEWAFGWGFTKLLAFFARGLENAGKLGPIDAETLAGVGLAHGFHLLSCLMLYQLSWAICPAFSHLNPAQFSFLAAGLHIISPAGMFLSAPYSESSFSFFNFLGLYLFAESLKDHSKARTVKSEFLMLLSGTVFGVNTTIRGNGLLSGLLYGLEGVKELTESTNPRFRRLSSIVLGGCLMAVCASLPHFLAYSDFCVNVDPSEQRRPWCSHQIPSIYAWVQSHYWHVGFLKYWTLSNLPLFLLAAPMLLVISISSLEIWALSASNHRRSGNHSEDNVETERAVKLSRGIVQQLAVPQMVLAILALTTYHVQIITRISSGYPVWYWWLSSMILDCREISFLGEKWSVAEGISKWMVMYALIQGGLFATFLPPA